MGRPEAKLIIYDGVQIVAEFVITKPQTILGRASDNDIILNDRLASRLHALIIEQNGGYIVRDNNSRNGTLVNGQKILETQLRSGDQIKIGSTVIEFVQDSAGLAAEASGQAENFQLGWQKEKPKKKFTWRPSKSLLITIVLIGIVLTPLFVWKQFIRPKPKEHRPYRVPHEFELGFMPTGDQDHADRVVYVFKGSREPASLFYQVYDIDDEDELDIYLNQQKLLDVLPTGSGNWSGERMVLIPQELVEPEVDNYIAFHHPHNASNVDFWASANNELWGVSNVDVRAKPEQRCEPSLAEEAFLLGKAKYEAKKIVLRNLYDAIKRLELCINYLQNCPDKPSYHMEAVNMLEGAKAELEQELKLRFFQAARYAKMKNFDQAESELRTIMSMVPDAFDEEHLKAKRELARVRENRVRQNR